MASFPGGTAEEEAVVAGAVEEAADTGAEAATAIAAAEETGGEEAKTPTCQMHQSLCKYEW